MLVKHSESENKITFFACKMIGVKCDFVLIASILGAIISIDVIIQVMSNCSFLALRS